VSHFQTVRTKCFLKKNTVEAKERSRALKLFHFVFNSDTTSLFLPITAGAPVLKKPQPYFPKATWALRVMQSPLATESKRRQNILNLEKPATNKSQIF
jgi:hypothetical protein